MRYSAMTLTVAVTAAFAAHAGTIVANGPVKALVVKIPRQPRDDVVFVN